MLDLVEKYSLRPRSSRRRDVADASPRRARAAPLSKYRRKNANARERSRMREINRAFEALRRAVPHSGVETPTANEKLTKITTLRLAMKYIEALSAALSQPSQELICSELDCFLLDSDGIQSDLSEHSLTPADFSSVEFGDEFVALSPGLGEELEFDPFLGFS